MNGSALLERSAEVLGAFQLHPRRNAARYPVVDALNAALVVAKQRRDLRRAAQGFDELCVVHGAITHHVEATVNAACINNPFTSRTMRGMHESVERLLQCARKSTGNREMTYSELASRLAVSPAVMTNWKARGISKEGAIKAEKAFGCTAHWILSGNHAERAPTVVRARLEGEPPPPDFTAREVSESDWAVLQDIQILPNEEREKLLNTIRAEAAKWKSLTDELIAKRMASTDRVTVTDRLLGGESQMGDLDTGTHK